MMSESRHEHNPLLLKALVYAKRGWKVFPLWNRKGDKCGCGDPDCDNQGKHPIPAAAPHGFKDATSEQKTIKKWWKRYPDAGIGIATGKMSGIVVIDIDLKKGKDGTLVLGKLLPKLGPLPDTKTARTPSGGLHRYYCYAEGIGSSNGKWGAGLDVKGDGGYVVAPPSHDLYKWVNRGGRAELPDAWIEHLRGKKPATKAKLDKRECSIEELAAAIDVIPNGPDVSRHEWINVGLALHYETGGDQDGFELFDEWSQKFAGYDADDTQKAWEGFKPEGRITAGTLFHLADQADPNWRANVVVNPDDEEEEGDGHNAKQADVLIGLALSKAELFHHDDDGYADIRVNDHRETRRIGSKGFRKWLLRLYFKKIKSTPTGDAMRRAIETIDAKAQFDGPMHAVHIRVGGHGDKLYVDFADDAWRAVEIDAEGWRIANAPPVRFRRTKGMLALPEPVRGGSIDELRAFLNMESDNDFVLVVSWLLAALRDRGPYPILKLWGEPGSAKSTTVEMLRALTDPNKASRRRFPHDDRDLFIAANNAHLLSYDNISHVPGWLSDSLCTLSTGGSYAKRTLYSDQDEELFEAMRPVTLNGVENFVMKHDLADRTIVLELQPIPDDARRLEKELRAKFEAARPRILGALFDIMAHGIRMLPQTQEERWPRMADFAQWATACETAVWSAGTFRKAYAGNRRMATLSAIDDDPVPRSWSPTKPTSRCARACISPIAAAKTAPASRRLPVRAPSTSCVRWRRPPTRRVQRE
jgi:hypothetical protein